MRKKINFFFLMTVLFYVSNFSEVWGFEDKAKKICRSPGDGEEVECSDSNGDGAEPTSTRSDWVALPETSSQTPLIEDRERPTEKSLSSKKLPRRNTSFIPTPTTINLAAPSESDLKQKTSLAFVDFNSCRWHPGFLRHVISGPGGGCATGENVNTCVGYVICKNKSGTEFIRQSTCSAANCAEDKASSCTKEENFWSREFVATGSKATKAKKASSQGNRQ